MSLNDENPGQKSKASCVSASPKSKGALARQGKSRESSFHETFVSHSLKQALIVTMCQIFKYLIKWMPSTKILLNRDENLREICVALQIKGKVLSLLILPDSQS